MVNDTFGQLNQNSQATADRLTGIDADNPLQTADFTRPLTRLSVGGVDVAAGAEVQLVAANAGRVQLEVFRISDNTGRGWGSPGQTAVTGVGVPLEAGQTYYQYTADSLHVINPTGSVMHFSWIEWGA